MHEEAVEEAGLRLDGVHVRDHAERGLRLAVADHPPDLVVTVPEQVRARRVPQRLADLRVDVIGVGVARVVERPVPTRIVLQAVQADGLRRHADPRRAAAKELGVPETPVGRGVQPAADVEPFDLDRAVELRRVLRAPHEDARPVRRGRGRLHVPAAVLGEGADGLVGAGRAFDEELLFDVAARSEVDRGQRRRLSGDRATHGGAGNGLRLGGRSGAGRRRVDDAAGADRGDDGHAGEGSGKHRRNPYHRNRVGAGRRVDASHLHRAFSVFRKGAPKLTRDNPDHDQWCRRRRGRRQPTERSRRRPTERSGRADAAGRSHGIASAAG